MPINRILIDADGCPVTDIAIRIAIRYQIACIILCDEAHFFDRDGAQTITLTKGADSVDFKIANLATTGDVIITQDHGLAAMCLSKRARVLNQDGWEYTGSNMIGLLSGRHESKRHRMAGGRTKGPPKRKPKQNTQFEQALTALLEDRNV